ncbi:MAG: cation-transporting P-type ATPase, partial [Rhodospirillales bacterium]
MAEAGKSSKQDLADRAWHAMAVEEALELLETDPETGLSDEEAKERQGRFGANRLTPQSERNALKRLLSQFKNMFIYLLLAASAVAAALGEWLDSGVIFG